MMTWEEKLKMYKEKERFIEVLSGVFQTTKHNSTVEGITYEVYTRPIKVNDELITEVREYVVVHFIGGGKSPRFVSGNSNIANFRVLGEMLNGGYYSEVRTYDSLIENGHQKVDL